MTNFSYKNFTVSDVMGMPNSGYRFNIFNERAQPVLSLVFEQRDDAEEARVEVAKAVEVRRPALTAAGEPSLLL